MPDGHDAEPPLNEPVIVPCAYASGIGIEEDGAVTRLVAWVRLPDFGGETTERRIVSRLVMTHATARGLMGALQQRLPRAT